MRGMIDIAMSFLGEVGRYEQVNGPENKGRNSNRNRKDPQSHSWV